MFFSFRAKPTRQGPSSTTIRGPQLWLLRKAGLRLLPTFLLCLLPIGLLVFSATLAAQETNSQPVPQAKTDRELYQSAAKSLAARQYAAATSPLQELYEKHPDFVLRDTVCVYLAECLIRQGQAESGFQLLQELQTRLGDNANETQSKVEPLDAKLLERVQTLQLYAARSAASDAEKQQRFSDSMKWHQWISAANPTEPVAIRKEMTRVATKAAWLQLQSGVDPQATLSELTKLSPILREQEAEILFSIAEKLTEGKRTQLALPIYEKLSARLPADGAMPAWAATVDLRLMQHFFQKKHYAACKRLFELAKKRYEPAKFAEFQFLQAQAAILRIEFETAVRLLREIEARAKEDGRSEHLAKAVWLQGEVSFLKRDYAKAILSYEQVLQLQSKDWAQRAALQRAKCLELSGQWELALAAYQQLKETKQESTNNKLIEQRIAVLQESIQTRSR